jgi:(+)-trans-carveol dehydrogenase
MTRGPRVAGKVALITGAARGQGRSHATRLAEEGADILAIDVCEPIPGVAYEMAKSADLEETARAVRGLGREIVTAEADVRDVAALRDATDAGVAKLGPLDIVVVNAGICTFDTVADMSEETWQTVIDINLTGAFHTVKAALPHLADGGSVIVISSVAGLKGFPGAAHYVAAKHGLVGLTRSLAHELGPRGIRVNSVHPTQVETDMLLNEATYRTFRPDLADPDVEDFKSVSESVMILQTPWVQAEDVSAAVLFLASDESRFVTGVALPIDAGTVAK